MYVTAVLLLLLLASLIESGSPGYKGLTPFDKATTLPLRGLLALLIVSHHLGQRSEIPGLSTFTSQIGIQTVAVFFFISGYGLCKSYQVKGDAYFDGFLGKRMGSFVPLFLLLTFGMMLCYYYISSRSFIAQIGDLAYNGNPPLPNSWFIYAIIYVYISFYICALITKSPVRLGVLFTLTSMIYVLVLRILDFPYFWIVTIVSVNLGYFVALYEDKITKVFKDHYFVCYTAMAAILFISLCAKAKVKVPYVSFACEEIWILAQTMAVYVSVRAMGIISWKWLRQVGVFSLELYLIHGIFLMIGQHIGLEDCSLWLFTYALSIPVAIILNRGNSLLFQKRVSVKY